MGSASANKLSSGNLLDDPKVASMMKRRENLESMLSDLKDENPLVAPDRPHPAPPTVLQPQVPPVALQSAVAPAQDLAPTAALQTEHAPLSAGESSTALVQQPSIQAPETPTPPVLTADTEARTPANNGEQLRETDEFVGEPMARSITEAEPRGRGRPLKSKTHKSETSYSLDPDLIKNLRILAAKQQIRLGRTVSTSEIVEVLLSKAMQLVEDDVVLAV